MGKCCVKISGALILIALASALSGCDADPPQTNFATTASQWAKPENGYCDPNKIACGYEQPRCMSIAPSQRAAKGC